MLQRINASYLECDPVFKKKPNCVDKESGHFDSPILFSVEKYTYVIVDPDIIEKNVELLFKIGTYLYYHPTSINQVPVTYFFGDINKCKSYSSTFTNQIIKIVSYEMIEQWYPKTISDINKYVINKLLDQQRYYGQVFNTEDFDMKLLLFIPTYLSDVEQNQSELFIKKQLFDKKLLIQRRAYDNKIEFIVSEDAIDMYQQDSPTDSKLAFIAIKFTGNEERIKRIQDAIAKAGYTPVVMNEFEHNNWIMPEVFHQIQISKFVVADFSMRCDGAYYESGYAYALGKEVIHTYDEREKENYDLHFDIVQKSTIMYNSLDELEDRLIKRIKATIY